MTTRTTSMGKTTLICMQHVIWLIYLANILTYWYCSSICSVPLLYFLSADTGQVWLIPWNPMQIKSPICFINCHGIELDLRFALVSHCFWVFGACPGAVIWLLYKGEKWQNTTTCIWNKLLTICHRSCKVQSFRLFQLITKGQLSVSSERFNRNQITGLIQQFCR